MDFAAVRAWQTRHGLFPDGKIGTQTLEKARGVTATAGPSAAPEVRAPKVNDRASESPALAHAPGQGPKHPELYASYGDWIASFDGLGSFQSTDGVAGSASTEGGGYEVLGEKATAANPAPSLVGAKKGEKFIDHVSNRWLQEHLPAELIRTAYQLPADCADIAVVLRHVWLFAHGRTEHYGKWVIGVGAGKTEAQRSKNIGHLLTMDVYSGSVQSLVRGGYGTRSFEKLKSKLSPGDVLVWEHHGGPGGARSGGHTMTIVKVMRDGDNITGISVLQGNQPIFKDQADDILKSEGVVFSEDGQPTTAAGKKEETSLRNLPGRRIERNVLTPNELKDVSGVWNWGDEENTTLVAAGPPGGV